MNQTLLPMHREVQKAIMKKLLSVISAALFLSTAVYAEGPYKAGDYVSDFSLKNVRGEMISLSQFETARGFIVIFSCNTCPVVVKYEDRMKDLHREFSSKGYPVIAINSNDKAVSPGDSYDEMQKTAKVKNYPFPIFMTSRRKL
jgi:peroxiredoxin